MRYALACLCFLVLAACGGGGQSPTSPTPPTQPAPQPGGIGSAGGTVSNGGAQIVVPAGALAQAVQIAIEQTDAGAPPLPAGVTAFGPMFAFTPHGTTFAAPATVTLPYDPAQVPAGTQLQLYKTDATQTTWQALALTSTGSNSVTAQVMGFSHMVVGGEPPPLERGEPERSWIFEEFLADGLGAVESEDQDGKPNNQTGGVVEDVHDFGPLPLNFDGDTNATGAVFSSETGGTYWVYAQGPEGSILTPDSSIGSRVTLVQKQGFKKNRDDARLKLHVTKIFMRAIDSNGGEILYPECPWGLGSEECGLTISSAVTFDVWAYAINTIFAGRSLAELYGHQGNWRGRTRLLLKGRELHRPLWRDELFVIDDDVGGVGSKQHVTYQLKEPLTIEIDISRVNTGDSFTLHVEAVAETYNRRQRESYVAAFFRDPIGIEGAEIETFGLDAVAVPFDEPPPVQPQAPECTSGDEAEGGALQFAAATFLAPEVPNGGRQVVITRSGGSLGEVSATVRTHEDTAFEGDDYEPVDMSVYFPDGDDEPRVVEVPLVLDHAPEIDELLTLTLSDPRGCAVLGTQASTTLTIQDDDRPEPEPQPSGLDATFGTDGKATLASFGGDESGMALQADGKIVMVGGRFLDFVLARFNADGSPDTSFGRGGSVTTDIAGGFAQERARAVAIQRDGKIVVAGESSLPSGDLAVALVRYNTDGTLDATFGSAGIAFEQGARGRAWDAAILSDGRIVVAGDAFVENSTTDFGDFLLARYTANGTLDLSFGSGGSVVTDINARTDLARNLVVQPNGALVVSGDPPGTGPTRRTGVARYTANGALDASFGTGGKLEIPRALVGRGLALQSDGRFVLVGSATVLNMQNDFSHFAVVRLNADGTFDNTFGANGITATSITGLTDVAHAVALQADGRIVVAGEGNLVNPNFALARYNTDGKLDTTFAVDGKLVVDFFGLEDRAENVALQADGKIVAGGLAVDGTNGYGLVRVNP